MSGRLSRTEADLLDDFIERGLRDDDEPNEYGHRMERLIDALGNQ